MSVATFSRRVIARYGPPAGVPYNASASFRSKTVWGCGRLLYGELGTIEEGLEQRLVRYRHIRTCVYSGLHSQAAIPTASICGFLAVPKPTETRCRNGSAQVRHVLQRLHK